MLPTGHACALHEPPRGALALALHAVSLLTQRRLIDDIQRHENDAHLIVLPPPCPLSIQPIDFAQADELIRRALTDTREFLDQGGEQRPPIHMRMHRHAAASGAAPGDRRPAGKTSGAASANADMSGRHTTPAAPPPSSGPVVEWRRRRLLAAGFAPGLAAVLARGHDVELHALLDLDRPRMPAAARRSYPRAPRSHGGGAVPAMTDAVSVARSFAAAGTTMQETSLHPDERRLDTESQEWLDALSGTGRAHDQAIERLHGLLLRAARFELARRRRALADSRPSELDDLATQAAADALMAILRKLHTYRGDSRFTTWAYKFALLEAAVKVRRRTWQDREVPLEDDGWAQLADRRSAPDTDAETGELLDAVSRAIAEALTPHQRAVLIAITLNDVPIDVLAARLSTTRGALYKTLHDARKKLRASLAADGHDPDHLREGGTR